MPKRINLKRVLVGALASVIGSAVRLAQALAWPSAAYIALSFSQTRIDPEAPDPVLVTVYLLGTLLLHTVIAVTTHRIVMLGEDAVPPWGLNRWTMRETRFAALGIGLGLMLVIALPFAMLIPVIGPALLTATTILVGACLFLVFPAAAVDQPIGYGDAWRMAQGNIGALIVCVWLFPMVLALPIVLLSVQPFTAPLVALLQMLVTVLTIAVLSMAYREINQPKPQPEPPGSADH